MTFETLCDYFEKLENTSSRLSLIDILSDLFSKANSLEIDKVIYLAQGRVAPFFMPVEIGMADKTVTVALSQAFSEKKEEVWQLYQSKGDMGLVALTLSQKFPHKKNNISVTEIFDRLVTIANMKGEGTVDRRITALKDILVQVNSLCAKHLVRIPLGKTRLGIGDPTILDSLALALLKDRGKRKLLEKAYNETSDLGLIGKTLLKGGVKAVSGLSVTIGRPIRSELCERLPNPTKVFEKMGKTIHASDKFDGFRVQIHKNGQDVTMFSRNLEEMTHMFPELIEGTLKQVKAKTAILDCEALAYQPDSEEFLPFQETTRRRRKYNIEEMAKSLPLKAFVFDVLYANGHSLIDLPLSQRMKELKKIVHNDEILLPAPGKYLNSPAELQLMLDEAISKGLEGVVVKKIDSPYEAGGRNFNWVKLKRHSSGTLEDTIDCVILGYIFGKGKRTAFGAGALLVGVYDEKEDKFVTVSKIGTGLSDEEWKSIKDKTKGSQLSHKPARVDSLIVPSVWVRPEIVIEVLADEITRSPLHTAGAVIKDDVKEPGYALRFPRLVSFREHDKKAEDATTVKELIEMFSAQGKAK